MRYYFGILAIIIFLFFGVKLIFGNSKKTNTTSNTKTSTLVKARLSDYSATNAEVSATSEGPVVGHDIHTFLRIVITRDERRVETVNGYNNLIIRSKILDNNQAAYDAFLHALEYDGFLTEVKPKYADDAGVCATGTKYIYELKNTGNKDNDKRLWSVSCGPGIGSAGGNGPLIRALFQAQIPDFVTVANGLVF